MVGKSKRAEIRRYYRTLRAAVSKTQQDVEALARLDAGRFWKIENGVVFPRDEERRDIARVLKVDASQLPSEATNQQQAVSA